MAHKRYPTNPPGDANVLNLMTYVDFRKSQRTTLSEARPIISTRLVRFIRELALPYNRLVYLATGLCAIVAIGCTAAIILSRLYPTADRLSELGLMPCAEALCFRGIIPGQTSWLDAIATFNGQLSADGSPFFGRIMLFPSMDDNSVEAILIDHPLDQRVLLGDIIALNGAPTCVQIDRHGDTLILHYDTLHVLTRFINNQMTPYTPVQQIVLRNHSSVCDSEDRDDINEQVAWRSWLGFASKQHYLDEN